MSATKVETITPKQAGELLATSYGNRPMNQNAILEYAVAMESGKWSPTASLIRIDDKDRLIDGHHRLESIRLTNKPIAMLVQRGVPTSDRDLVDTGRKRTLNDLTSMYTTRANVNAYNAALNVCCNLVTRGSFRRPRINTLDAARKWGALFADGLDYCVAETQRIEGRRSSTNAHLRVFRVSYVTGAFSFAFKRNPAAVKSFLRKCMDGESIDATMPVYTVRNLILSAEGRVAGGGAVVPLTVKILSGLYASIKGESFKTAQAGREGWEYFAEAYDTAQLKNLLDPYVKLVTEREAAMKKLKETIKARAAS